MIPCRSLLVVAPCFVLAAGAAVVAPDETAIREPRLTQAQLELAPTAAQLRSLPRFPAEWWLPPDAVRDLTGTLAALNIPPAFSRRVIAGAQLQPEGTAVIHPETGWLDDLAAAERESWEWLLQLHRGNVTVRWPLAIRATTLGSLEADERLREVVRRVRRWGRAAGEHVIFTELWALEDAFPSDDARTTFFRAAFASTTPFLKLSTESTEIPAASDAAYWQVNGRFRAIEPFFNAVRRVEDKSRIDLVHLLPRFARGVLYTFPPEFAAGRDLGVESGLVAAGFFAATPDDPAVQAAGFSAWLNRECEPLHASSPSFGDILVFEDPARTRWPYAAVYIADGFVLSRQPTLFGPWRFLRVDDIRQLNPRLGQVPVQAFRRKASLNTAGEPAHVLTELPAAWDRAVQLEAERPGPWGRLASYPVLLAPAGDLLARLEAPAAAPEWPLFLPERSALLDRLAALPIDPVQREALCALVREAPLNTGLVTVRPALATVWRVPPLARAEIFRHLVPGTTSDAYAQTIRIPSRMPAEAWFPAGSIPEPARSALLTLTYPVGNSIAFSDFGALFTVLPPQTEARLAALRTICRVPALVVLLEKPALEDVPALAAYWGGGEQKDLEALLRAFATNREFRHLDISHLLPPLAREYLNLYGFTPAGEPAPSCYWSALNFDVRRPDSRLLTSLAGGGAEARIAWEKLQRDYEPIPGPSALGDIIAYRRGGRAGELEHVCTYIAADIVFTKNGLGLMAPWCLMRLADVDSLYHVEGEVERLCFRRRAEPGAKLPTASRP